MQVIIVEALSNFSNNSARAPSLLLGCGSHLISTAVVVYTLDRALDVGISVQNNYQLDRSLVPRSSAMTEGCIACLSSGAVLLGDTEFFTGYGNWACAVSQSMPLSIGNCAGFPDHQSLEVLWQPVYLG